MVVEGASEDILQALAIRELKRERCSGVDQLRIGLGDVDVDCTTELAEIQGILAVVEEASSIARSPCGRKKTIGVVSASAVNLGVEFGGLPWISSKEPAVTTITIGIVDGSKGKSLRPKPPPESRVSSEESMVT